MSKVYVHSLELQQQNAFIKPTEAGIHTHAQSESEMELNSTHLT